MSQILEKVTDAVRRRAASLDLDSHSLVNQVLDAEIESSRTSLTLHDEINLRQQLDNRLYGFGPLQSFIEDPDIEEIWINSPDAVFIARGGVSECLNISISSVEISVIVERMLRPTGRRLDRSTPFVDASLPDGSRLHVVIPDITRNHWSVNIRKFPKVIYSMADLLAKEVVTPEQCGLLVDAVESGKNILVSGATQSGKTTLLCALLSCLGASERLITVEETFEIRSSCNDWVAMQTRQANLEGVGQVSLRRLIKEALRMRPSRLVVGEVREAEALDLLIAMNSGLPGLCTIHANSAEDALLKLATLPLLAGGNISMDFVRPTVASCIDLVVHCELESTGRRRVTEIRKVLAGFDAIRSEIVG